jgi:hypothetical protein
VTRSLCYIKKNLTCEGGALSQSDFWGYFLGLFGSSNGLRGLRGAVKGVDGTEKSEGVEYEVAGVKFADEGVCVMDGF